MSLPGCSRTNGPPSFEKILYFFPFYLVVFFSRVFSSDFPGGSRLVMGYLIFQARFSSTLARLPREQESFEVCRYTTPTQISSLVSPCGVSVRLDPWRRSEKGNEDLLLICASRGIAQSRKKLFLSGLRSYMLSPGDEYATHFSLPGLSVSYRFLCFSASLYLSIDPSCRPEIPALPQAVDPLSVDSQAMLIRSRIVPQS